MSARMHAAACLLACLPGARGEEARAHQATLPPHHSRAPPLQLTSLQDPRRLNTGRSQYYPVKTERSEGPRAGEKGNRRRDRERRREEGGTMQKGKRERWREEGAALQVEVQQSLISSGRK